MRRVVTSSWTLDGASRGRVVSILDHDAELFAAVPQDDRLLARRSFAGRVTPVLPGPLHLPDVFAQEPVTWGALVLSGVLVRVTRLGRAELPELLGPGDLLGPPDDGGRVLPTAEEHTVVERGELVVLGRRAAAVAGRWPELLAVLSARREATRRRAVALGAIAHQPHVGLRLLALLWHLAERWGRPHGDGTVVPFPLSHETLGRFVAARRSTVTLGLRELEERGLVVRRDDGSWLLGPESQTALRLELGAAVGRVPDAVYRPRVTERAIDAAAAARRRAVDLRSDAAALTAQAQQLGRRRRDHDGR
jgi:hypothetical protein